MGDGAWPLVWEPYAAVHAIVDVERVEVSDVGVDKVGKHACSNGEGAH